MATGFQLIRVGRLPLEPGFAKKRLEPKVKLL
jgi:hypothetical protein